MVYFQRFYSYAAPEFNRMVSRINVYGIQSLIEKRVRYDYWQPQAGVGYIITHEKRNMKDSYLIMH